MIERLASDCLINFNITPREFSYQFRRSFWQDFVFIRVAMIIKPKSEELFIKIFRLFTFIETPFITARFPVSGRVLRVDFIYQRKLSGRIYSKFIFCVYQNESVRERYFLSSFKQSF